VWYLSLMWNKSYLVFWYIIIMPRFMQWALYYNKLFLLKTKSRVHAVMEIQEQLRQECPKRAWPEFQKRSWAEFRKRVWPEFQKRSWAEFQKQSWAEWIPAVPIHKRKSFLQRKWQFIDKMCRLTLIFWHNIERCIESRLNSLPLTNRPFYSSLVKFSINN